MKNKINHPPGREQYLWVTFRFLQRTMRQSDSPYYRAAFPGLLQLIKSRGQSAKATEKAGTAEIASGGERGQRDKMQDLSCRADSISCRHHTTEHQCASPWGLLSVRGMLGGDASLLGSHGCWHHMLHSSQQGWEVGMETTRKAKM